MAREISRTLNVEYCGSGIWIAEAKLRGKWTILSYMERPTYKKAKEDFLLLATENR